MSESLDNTARRPWPVRVFRFYYDGFRSMTSTGRTLWMLIILKVIILFAVLKLFFFPDILQRDYSSDQQRAEAGRTALSSPPAEHAPDADRK